MHLHNSHLSIKIFEILIIVGEVHAHHRSSVLKRGLIFNSLGLGKGLYRIFLDFTSRSYEVIRLKTVILTKESGNHVEISKSCIVSSDGILGEWFLHEGIKFRYFGKLIILFSFKILNLQKEILLIELEVLVCYLQLLNLMLHLAYYLSEFVCLRWFLIIISLIHLVLVRFQWFTLYDSILDWFLCCFLWRISLCLQMIIIRLDEVETLFLSRSHSIIVFNWAMNVIIALNPL